MSRSTEYRAPPRISRRWASLQCASLDRGNQARSTVLEAAFSRNRGARRTCSGLDTARASGLLTVPLLANVAVLELPCGPECLATPLSAGNVVIVKHASNVPQAAAAFEQLLLEAGAPKGAYTNVYATKDQINTLIDDPRVRGVALTGSEGAGAVVAARAGKNLKKSTLELGGSDPFIALADCDLDKTVEWALHGRVFNGGQCCVASKRIIVVDEIADEFLAKFQVAMSQLKGGDPFDEATTLPPMSSQHAADELYAQINAAVEARAKAIVCGEPVPTTARLDRPWELQKMNYLSMYQFPCHGVGRAEQKERERLNCDSDCVADESHCCGPL